MVGTSTLARAPAAHGTLARRLASGREVVVAGERVRTKRVYEPAEPTDGHRVLVDRLWPRGLAKAAGAMDAWAKEAAPSTELRRWFHKDRSQWEEFRRRYLDELRANPAATEDLVERVRGGGRVTLLYASRDEEQNHAMVLAEHLMANARAEAPKKGAKKAGAKKATKKATKKAAKKAVAKKPVKKRKRG